MSRLDGLVARLRSLFGRRTVERRMAAEFQFHVEMETEHNLRLGMAPAEARRRALVEFGGAERYREEMREGRGLAMIREMVDDARLSLRLFRRQLARAPLFSTVVIAVLALGIGINAGLLTVLHVYAWQPAPGITPDPALARITATASRGDVHLDEARLSYPEIQDLREQRHVFAEVAASGGAWLPADFGGGVEPVIAFYATANYFNVLRVPMAAGTGFPEGIDQSSDPIAVISHSLWTSHFDGSRDAVGKTVRIMNLPFTIIGVAPPHFTGIDAQDTWRPFVWIPLGAREIVERGRSGDLARRDVDFLEPFARLAPGVGAGEVGRMTATLSARMARLEPGRRVAFRAERLTGLRRSESGTKELIAAVAIVATLIVVITCTNVGALLLGRAVARRREVGVRLALGATRFRIIRQMLMESLVYALAGALLGLALYTVAIRIAYATIPETIYGLEPRPATFLATAVLALMATIVFGLVPALHASRAGIGEVIKNSGSHAVRRSRLQATFVVLQLASSQPVLVVTGLVLLDMRRSLATERAPASVVTMYANLLRPSAGDDTPRSRDSAAAAAKATLGLIRERLREIPGVRLAAIDVDAGNAEFEAPGEGNGRGGVAAETRQVHVTSDYFAARGIPIARGRAIGIDEDRWSGVAVVSEAAAARFWPGLDPIGQRLVRRAREPDGASTPLEVIGVVGRAPYDENRPQLEVFVPLALAESVERPGITVRTSGNARALVPEIRAAIREVESYAAMGDVRTLAERYDERRRSTIQANAAAFAVGAAALLLASLGLYAVIAFTIAQRTHEIGVRLAIGASPRGVVGQFLRSGVKLSALGLAIGVPVTVAGIRLVQANLVGFTPRMIAVVLVVVPVLTAVAAFASWLPARRAGRVDPLIALRSE